MISCAAAIAAAALLAPGVPKDERIGWWRDARFGMFIHWGLYSIPAGVWEGKEYRGAAEWLMYSAQIPVADYQPLRDQFNPVKFNAREWVKLAKQAGMKYIVITSKHHDGFCLWDSKLTTWDVMGTPFKRDILKELAEACRKEHMRLGFYHSIMDWTHPLYGERRPWDPRKLSPKPDMDRYTEHMKGQLKELLTNYGDVATVWFDGEWESPWTHERGKDLYDYVLSLQPRTIINNRVDTGRSGMAGMTSGSDMRGDYGTPEQEVPTRGMPGVDWESCMTMNDTWGFNQLDHNWKSAKKLVQTLVETASKGGNFLLNVGPTSAGIIPPESQERLKEMGKWLAINKESIYGTGAGPFAHSPYRWTSKKGVLYCHIADWKAGSLSIEGLKTPVTSVELLAKGGPRKVDFHRNDDSLTVDLVGEAPSPYGSVLKLKLAGPVSVVEPGITQAPDGSITLMADRAELAGGSVRVEGDWLGYWTDKAATASWTFEVTKPGRFWAEAEYAVDPAYGRSKAMVSIGSTAFEFKPEVTGGWQKFVKKPIGPFVLPAGKSTLIVEPIVMEGALCNLRAVRLLPAK